MIVNLIPYTNKPNANGRVYTPEAIDKMVELFNEREMPMYGQVGYPQDILGVPVFDTSLQKVSHIVSSIKKVDGYLVGDIKILDTPYGKHLQRLIKGVVFRPRSAGTVDVETGIINIHKIYSFDAIPRDEDAFIEYEPSFWELVENTAEGLNGVMTA